MQASALGTKWRVRPLAEEELFSAAEIQFEGFHKPQKFQLLDALARMTFRYVCSGCSSSIGDPRCGDVQLFKSRSQPFTRTFVADGVRKDSAAQRTWKWQPHFEPQAATA